MMQLLWMFLPDEALPLILVGIGLLTMLGLLRGRLGAVLVPVLLLPVIAPFAEALIAGLPPWAALAVLAIVGLTILRALAGVVVGRRAADHMTGILAADLVRVVLAACVLPFRVIARLLSNGR
jgi:hypothetical protein